MKRTLLLSAALILFYQEIFSQSEGPLNPMTASYSAAGCLACPGGEWNNFQYITNADHQYAEVTLAAYPSCFQSTCYYSRILFAYDFGFTIPAAATITGVKAAVLRMSTAATAVSDSAVQLFNGQPTGMNHASQALWTPALTTEIYGDSTDTWGIALTPDSVNSNLFGLAVQVMNKNLSASFITASVDHITMTVYYSTGTGIQSQTRYNSSPGIYYNASNTTLILFPPAGKINSVRLTDLLGNKILIKGISKTADDRIEFKTPLLSRGMYILISEIGGSEVVEKFFVQ